MSTPWTRRSMLATAALPLAQGLLPTLLAPAARAAAWPEKPVKVIIPFSAGGTADIVARLLANGLGERLGQPVVVEARAGANGIIGADAVAKSPADGYTLLLNSSAHAINASLYKKLPFDTERGFVAVAPVVPPAAFVIVVNPSLPIRNMRELVDYARAHPDRLSYGSGGVGNGLHVAGEMLAQMADVKLLHVPYKGAAPIINDLVGGQLGMMFNSPLAVQAFVRDGKLRMIAQTGARRLSSLPDLPTVAESGVPGLSGYEATSWYGLYAPAGTPADIVARLNAETVRVMNSPSVVEKLASLGTGALPPLSPAEFTAFNRVEIERFGKVIRAAGPVAGRGQLMAPVHDAETVPTVAARLLDLERQRADAIVAGDEAMLRELLHPKLVHVHTRGNQDSLESYLHYISKVIQVLRVERRDLHVEVHGACAIMTGGQTSVARLRGSDAPQVEVLTQVMQVWVAHAGRWRQAAFQATLTGAAPPVIAR